MSRYANLILRLLFTLLLLFSAWYLPFWLTATLFLLGVLVFSWFLEGALVLLSLDVVFGVSWFPALGATGLLLLCLREALMMYVLTK